MDNEAILTAVGVCAVLIAAALYVGSAVHYSPEETETVGGAFLIHEPDGDESTTYYYNPRIRSPLSIRSASGPSFDEILTEEKFNQMFPNRNQFYTYQGLINAAKKYPTFGNTGTETTQRREVAAFLAHVAQETSELRIIEEQNKQTYCDPSSSVCSCALGKQYYGRGPLQLSWNFNYCKAGMSLGYDLRNYPELVSQRENIAWETSLWFWMTLKGAGNYDCHTAITKNHGFGETIRTINGALECDRPSIYADSRIEYYKRYAEILGTTPGTGLSCGSVQPE